MRFTCPAKPLFAALKVALSAVPSRTTKPVLACVCFGGDADGPLTVSATDLEVGVRATVADATIAEGGRVLIPADRLAAILGEAGTATVEVRADGDTVTVVPDGCGRFELPYHPAEEYPEIPAGTGPDHVTIDGATLAGLIARTAFAVAKADSARWATTGVLFEVDPGKPHKLRLVGTDTKRLAVADAAVESSGEPPAKAAGIVPAKAVRALERMAGDGGTVAVRFAKNSATFDTATGSLHTQLVEGRFPPWKDILPKGKPAKIDLPAAEACARVRQAAIMTDAESKRVDFAFGDGAATITARGATAGSSRVELPLPGFGGDAEDIAFDPAYLVEFLRVVGDLPVVFEHFGGEKPALFRVPDYLYLVMPMAV